MVWSLSLVPETFGGWLWTKDCVKASMLFATGYQTGCVLMHLKRFREHHGVAKPLVPSAETLCA